MPSLQTSAVAYLHRHILLSVLRARVQRRRRIDWNRFQIGEGRQPIMTCTTPQRLIDLFAIADRAVTAELFKIASAIAAGSTTTSIVTEAPAFLRATFPNLADDDLNRVAILLSWGQYIQHTCTTRELSRKWRLTRTIGVGDDDALDYALAQGAELCEQKFVEWALDLPRGAAAASADRLMSAFAERVAGRIAAHMWPAERT
jgi:hypothetical protein